MLDDIIKQKHHFIKEIGMNDSISDASSRIISCMSYQYQCVDLIAGGCGLETCF